MKLLFVSNLFPDTAEPYRGLDNATLLHHLADRWEIRVLSPRPALPFLSRHWRSRASDALFQPRFIPTPYVPKFGSRWNHRLMAAALRRPLRQLQRDFDFDVVLGSWLFPDCCALAELAHELGFPFVAIAQGSDVHQYLQMPSRRDLIVRLLPRAAALITRSRELARLLSQAGLPPERLHPIYNGVDLEQFSPGDRPAARRALSLPPDEPLVLFVGNFYPVKNPLLAVSTLAALSDLLPATRPPALVMIGGGPLETDVRDLARRLGLASRVILPGRIDPAGVVRYMQAADVLVLPSENEGVPNVVLEAFACGLPVVAARVGGLPEVHPGSDCGLLVDRHDPGAFARALHAVLVSPPDSVRLRQHALPFSWGRTADACNALLERLRR